MTLLKNKHLSRFNYKNLIPPFLTERTRAVVNPFVSHKEKVKTRHTQKVFIYDYNAESLEMHEKTNVDECGGYRHSNTITWINIDGFNKHTVEKICTDYDIHALLQEDILSFGQRPKMDDVEDTLFVLLNMLYFNEETSGIEQEQISIAMKGNTIISFQEDPTRDVFNPLRDRLKIASHKIRQRGADYLFYSLLDVTVNSYFTVIEKLGDRIEQLEESLMLKPTRMTFQTINQLRKEIILLKRNTVPVRDLIASLMRSESDLLEERTIKYFKDIYDHIVQANDLTENYRDMITALQDLYLNTVNLRMNEVMKTLAIVTSIMAPATVIGGIFGMNFDVIPYAHHNWGFYGTIVVMLIIPVIMILWFRRRGWFNRDIGPEPTESQTEESTKRT